ncbi:MAG TPA: DUF1697 domain-containing protein [Labilithrix sp.]|nr:DUF1697 domain-containing protein [Labilithrix sp.]
MQRYAAFLRGVSPMNAKMPELKKSFEAAGFKEVKTLRSSGNVIFTSRTASEKALESKAEKAMSEVLGRTFLTIVRPVDALREMLERNPFAPFPMPPKTKRVVTFLRERATAKLALPIELEGARILLASGREIFSAYVPSPRGAVFMTLIEKTFGKEITTRTWETVEKVAH